MINYSRDRLKIKFETVFFLGNTKLNITKKFTTNLYLFISSNKFIISSNVFFISSNNKIFSSYKFSIRGDKLNPLLKFLLTEMNQQKTLTKGAHPIIYQTIHFLPVHRLYARSKYVLPESGEYHPKVH